jgi:hypothetical protein
VKLLWILRCLMVSLNKCAEIVWSKGHMTQDCKKSQQNGRNKQLKFNEWRILHSFSTGRIFEEKFL